MGQPERDDSAPSRSVRAPTRNRTYPSRFSEDPESDRFHFLFFPRNHSVIRVVIRALCELSGEHFFYCDPISISPSPTLRAFTRSPLVSTSSDPNFLFCLFVRIETRCTVTLRLTFNQFYCFVSPRIYSISLFSTSLGFVGNAWIVFKKKRKQQFRL